MNLLGLFTDPILRGPTLGAMLMCLAASMMGVLVFVRKRSLLGEALSHATYPGVTSAIVIAGFFSLDAFLPVMIFLGACASSFAGFWIIEYMEKKIKVASDAALGVVLALFFGIGVTIASFAQNSYTQLYSQMQSYLYGQAATMTDVHIFIYGILALIVIVFCIIFYKQILMLSFDPLFARTNGMERRYLNLFIFTLIVLSLVIGIRCVGVILMSAMLIAPAAAARQFTNRLSTLFFLSALFGCCSALLGVYGSFLLSKSLNGHYFLPTGPAIVLVSGGIALFSLFFAPNRGLMSRYIRIAKFKTICRQENLLKAFWRFNQEGKNNLNFKEIYGYLGFSSWHLRWLLYSLCRQKALMKKNKYYQLTSFGLRKGARIIRLHRLWEVYLVNSLGLKVERAHKSAEEMEHILTPALEKKLTEMLDNPTQDPHHQPIPAKEEGMYVF